MKKIDYSQYKIGDELVVTQTYHGFTKTQIVIVVDPQKKKEKKEYCISVRDSKGKIGTIPTKFVKLKKSSKKA